MNNLSRDSVFQIRKTSQTAMLLMLVFFCVEGCVLEGAESGSNAYETTEGRVDVSDSEGSFSDGQNLARDEKDGEMGFPRESPIIPNEFTNCHYQGIPLWGEVEVVDSFPDIKVKIVGSFAELEVEIVESFPEACGQWQWVDSFPDFTIQFVESFPDLTIKYVDSFPGVN
jgi:hypothetical protein